jgi:hypothetical protein
MVTAIHRGPTPCTSTRLTSPVSDSENFLRKAQMAKTRKGEFFGFAFVTAASERGCVLLTCGRGLSLVAAAIDMQRLLRRWQPMGTHPAGRSVRSIRRGRKCTRGAATQITTASIDTEGAESRFATNGRNSMDSSRTWASHGLPASRSTASTMMAITSLEIAGGPRQRSKRRTERLGEVGRTKLNSKIAASLFPFRFVAVMAKAKKDGGGWDMEAFE